MTHDNYDNNNIVELIDESNVKSYFSHLATVQYQGEEYVVLQPVGEIDGVNEDEVMILRIAHTDGMDVYEGITDSDTLQEVFDYFLMEAQEAGGYAEDEPMDIPKYVRDEEVQRPY